MANKNTININIPYKWVGIVLLLAAIPATYLGLKCYARHQAKHDLENIGIVFSEHKFIESACHGDDGTVALFLKAGMDMNVLAISSVDGRVAKSALHCAALTGNLTLAESLLKLGMDASIKDGESNTPLYNAVGYIRNKKGGRSQSNLPLVELLLKHKVDINAAGEGGAPIVASFKSSGNSSEVYDYLLEKGADVNVKNKQEMTPLMLFAQSYKHNKGPVTTRILALIEAGADINARNKRGETALMLAARKRSKEVVNILLESGADINVENNNSETAIGMAISNIDNFKLFLAHGANPNIKLNNEPLLYRAATRNPATLKLLLDYEKTDVNVTNNRGDTVLHYLAGRRNHARNLPLLLAKLADVDVTNNRLETPLIKAARSRSLEAMKLLLEAGANVNAKDTSGFSALHYVNKGIGYSNKTAAYKESTHITHRYTKEYEEMRDLLLKHGAKL